jgi:N-carbamoyl-L-amino-acid hydrolase
MPPGFREMWADLLPIGRSASTGGYHRYAWTEAELACRAWFVRAARARDLDLEQDRNGNLFAWWGGRGPDAVVTGSHLDSVPGGGAFDGPLGVVSALAALDELRARGVRPARPLGIAVFAEEEGARFGVACLGSRLLTGAIAPARARGLTDATGMTLADALAGADPAWADAGLHGRPADEAINVGGSLSAYVEGPLGSAMAGLDPLAIGRDDELLGRIGCFVELHVEQGRALEVPVGIASSIWPHGRWRLDFHGRGDHAGTTRLADRRDPMLPFAHTVLAARAAAERHEALATVGKVQVVPGGVNAIPSRVTAWLDARGPADAAVRAAVEDVRLAAVEAGALHGVTMTMAEESYTEVVAFNTGLRDRLVAPIEKAGLPTPPVLPTGAGHDAGILSAHVPTAMIFVRNPTGISHAPQEYAEEIDCLAGVAALAAVLQDLVSA